MPALTVDFEFMRYAMERWRYHFFAFERLENLELARLVVFRSFQPRIRDRNRHPRHYLSHTKLVLLMCLLADGHLENARGFVYLTFYLKYIPKIVVGTLIE